MSDGNRNRPGRVCTHLMHGVAAGALLAVMAPSGAVAQDDAAADADDRIIVTGSRIRRAELVGPTPVASMTDAEIAQTGRTNIEAIVGEIPALIGSTGDANAGAGAFVGANFLNLRNLGASRTLVLVNGQRHVGSNEIGTSAVDVNSIPVGLIERVEVTTGGASAIYGADGVSGVVNFIMKDDFEGVRVNLQGGLSGHADADDYFASVIAGQNFGDGRGNVTVSYEFNGRDGLRAADRDYLSTDTLFFMNNPAEVGGDVPGEPRRLLFGDVRDTFVAANGIIDPFRLFSPTFVGNEILDRGIQVGSAPPSAVPSATIGGNSTELWRIINWGVLPNVKRHTATISTHYDFAPEITGFVDVKYSNVRADSINQSTFSILNRALPDNPFLPPAVAAAAALVGAGTPFGPPILYSRFDIDTGGESIARETTTFRIVGGFEGDLADWLSYNLTANYGKSDVQRVQAIRRDDRYFAALDVVTNPATGLPECRSTLTPAAIAATPIGGPGNINIATVIANGTLTFTPGANSGCVPLNPFIDDYATNAPAYDWIFAFDPVNGKLTQTVINGYFSGDGSPIGLEFQGGPVAYVFGAEYRKEKSSVDFPTLLETGPTVFDLRGLRDSSGEFDVWETFTEVSLPLFKDQGPILDELTIDGAYRFSDYSTIGKTHTWKVGGVWAPIPDVRFRGTRSHAIRAPNINELFSPLQPFNALPSDPCSAQNLAFGSPTRLANCTSDLALLGLTPGPGLMLPSTAVNFTAFQGGNPNLSAETADTFTYGFVLQPSFIPGFTATVDYWNIKMSDGVISPPAQSIVNSCYDAASLNNPFCALIGRAANGDLNRLQTGFVNVAQFITSGVDFSARYGIDLESAGDLTFVVNGSYLDRLDIQSTPAPNLDDEKGEAGTLLGINAPTLVINYDMVWTLGQFEVAYGFNYHDKLLRIENVELPNALELQVPFKAAALWNHDIRFAYNRSDNIQLYAGIRNLTNQEPAPNSFATPIDAVGRFFFAGATIGFDSIGDLGRAVARPF